MSTHFIEFIDFEVEMGPDPTRAYFWPAANKRLTRLRPGYFPTQHDEIFLTLRGKKLKNFMLLGEIFQIFDYFKGIKKILKTHLFGFLYCAAPVWLNELMSSRNWRLLESIHYRTLRTVLKDYSKTLSKSTLNSFLGRAKPKQWM